MNHNTGKRVLSMLMALVMVLGMFPVSVFAEGVPETLVTSLTELYSGDETRAREDLEALDAAGLLDENGKLVELDICEDGESVELTALAERITNGGEVGEITVNGNAATPEQIVQISQVNAAIEIAQLLDEEIDVTDEHVDNLESLLNGMQDGSVDLENALQSGAVRLMSADNATLMGTEIDLTIPGNWPETLTVSDDGLSYIASYISGSTYEPNHAFKFGEPDFDGKAQYAVGYTGSQGTGNPTTETDIRRSYFDWENAIVGVDENRATPTVTVVLPLKTDDAIQNRFANDNLVDITENGIGIEMELPTYGKTNLRYYNPYMYFSNSNNRRYPAYLVENTSERITAVVTRFSAMPNLGENVRLDTLSLFVNNDSDTNQLPAWSSSSTDELGYHYWTSGNFPVISGRCLRYYIDPVVLLTRDKFVVRPEGSWEQAEHHFIKLKNPENPDFPYVYPWDIENPQNQHDVERMYTEDYYNGLVRGFFYLGADEDLRSSVRISKRRDFTLEQISKNILPTLGAEASDYVFRWYLNGRSSSEAEITLDPLDDRNGTRRPETTLIPLKPYTTGSRYYVCLSVYPCGIRSYNSKSTSISSYNNDYETSDFCFYVKEAEPYLMVPRFSRIRQTVTGTDTDLPFYSDVTQRNKGANGTTFQAELYKISNDQINLDAESIPSDAQRVTVNGWGSFPSTENNPVTHITVPGSALDQAGTYAVKISTGYSDGTTEQTLSTIVYLNVKQTPATIKLGKLESSYTHTGNIPEITYSLENAVENTVVKYTIQQAGNSTITEQTGSASGGTISIPKNSFEGLKTAYTITVYARNSEEDPWSVDSMLLTVYNNDILELLMKDVALGDIGGSTGGAEGNGTEKVSGTVNIDNSSKIAELVDSSGEGTGYQISNYDFDDLRANVGLQRVISANYGSGVWGVISDRMKWSYTEKDGRTSDAVTLNNKEHGSYSDLRNYSYTSYIPTTDFLIVATEDRSSDAPVTITATHANSGMTKSINVTVNTLKDKLYLFRFNPKAETEVVYTNGDTTERKLKTNAQGELVVYEPSGIKSAVVAKSEYNEETYVGTILNSDLASGERNITTLDIYPCNNLTLKPISSQTLTFLTPDGKPYTGSVILRNGVYAGSEYCPDAGIYISKGGSLILRDDANVTVSNGEATVWFDPSQFVSTSNKTWADGLKFVFEYRFENSYQPGYVVIDASSDVPADSIVNLQPIRGSAKVPQITRQEYQQYLNGTKPTSYTRNVIDYTDNIGISPNFPKSVLYTDIALLGETVGVGEAVNSRKGYSTYEGENAAQFAFYTIGGEKLDGQTDFTGANLSATQITNLNQLRNANLFVFPFSAVPMLRSTYTMTDGNLSADGISDQDTNSTSTARIEAVFTRGGMTVANINMPFGVTNVFHHPNLTSSTEGAAAVGKEVRQNLRENTDIGSIFRSINVNDMIRRGFVFLGNLAGAGGDNPINLMILPTADPATFRIIAFIGKNQRGGDDDGDGVSVNFNAQDLAEDMNKFKKEMEELNKKKDDENDSGGEGSMQFNFYGTIILEARVGIADGKWNINFRGGNVGTNVKGKYEWGQTFFCGPYPAFISFEIGFHADLEVAFGNKSAVRAMLLDAALGVSVEAFAGLGFDLSIVAIQLGIYGQIGADVNFLLLTPSNESAKTGTKLTISGEIGIKLKVKLLFISYSKKFASTGFSWTKKWNNYDQIKKYWNDQGFGQLFGVTRSGRPYTMYLFEDGSTIVEIEGRAELENRDYLELAERSWTGGAASGRRLLGSTGSVTNAITNVETNSYPYAHPAFTDDGELFLYVSDNNNANDVQSVVSYAVKSGAGYENAGRVDASTDNILADLDVVASGTKNNAFAAWVKQVETPRRADKNAEVTNDELGMMFNATEIYAGSYDGTAWTTEQLTDNYVADMAPTVASSGNKAVVVWRSMNASSMAANGANVQDITAMFNVENNINYRVYNGTTWTDAQIAYNGSAGTVNAIDSAMLPDGTAILVYTVRTGEDVTSTETFYTVIKADGSILTTGRLTNDSYTDANAQATAVNEDGGYFVLGWYSEHDAGEGMTSEYDDNGNATQKAVVAHDIRLARINANGSYDIDFPESIGGTGETGISSDFHFSAPANNAALENVSVVWSQRKDSNAAEDAGKYELNAVRFFKAEGVTGVTAPTNIATTDKNYTIDRFDAYTDGDRAIHAIILGTDYNTIEGIGVYDSIDLNAAADNTVTSNSAEPNNLDILDGEAISSLKLATGTFPETAADVTADINISEVIPGFTTPVQFTVTNTGTSKLTSVTATVGDQIKEFTGLNLLPNQSATLLMSYNVPESAVSDPDYTVTSSGTTLGSGTLTLNRPDVGISGIKLLREYDGKRDIQVMLGNSSAIPLAGSDKTVKLAFYKDPFHESMIGEAVSITDDALAEIDAGTYTTVQTLEVTDIAALVDGEIPEDGVTVYARAWVADTEEPNTYNNDNYLSFTGLLARNNGQKLTTDTSVEENEGGYTVYADIRNNSMKDVNVGTPVALLLDDAGNVIAQKNFQDASLTLTKEKSSGLSATFNTSDIPEGKTLARAAVGTVCTVTFDLNGGTSNSTIAPVQTDLAGHITLPTTIPTKTVETGQDPLFFGGWYTAAEGGERITESYTFTSDTTVYAHYVNHQHNFTYSAEGTTITAACSNADGFCYLPDVGNAHKATLTIAAPESTAYTGTAIPAVITDENGIQGDAKVMYATKGEGDTYGEASETVPVNVGTYQASITLGSGDGAKTVSVEYTITNATLTNVSVAQNGTLTYTGNVQTPQVTTAATAVSNQTVSYTYSLTENGEYGDMPTFTNVEDAGTVYFKASAPNHETESGSFTVTMNKANQTAPAVPTLNGNPRATKITLTTVDNCEYSKDNENWQNNSVFIGLDRATQYTFYQRIKGDKNHNPSPASSAQFTTGNHDHEWINFTANEATITATCNNTDNGHGDNTSATMTIAAPTLTAYGGTGDVEATVTNNIEDIETPAIVYKQGETVLEAAPTVAGTYTASITLSAADIGQASDVTASVTYTIAKAPLTITAKPKTITYGDAPTNDGVTYSGFVNNETESALGGTLGYDYSYTQYGDVSSESNTYTITPKNLTSDNYAITFATGTLTVEQKEVGLNWSNLSFDYDGQSHKPTATATGTVNSDIIGVTVTGEQTNAGSSAYTATASALTGDKAGNYKLPSAVTQTYTIAKAPLTITAKPKTITYGDAPTNDGVTYSGFVNNETESALGGTLGYDYSYTQYGDVSSESNTYTITPKNLTSDNYAITFATGTLTVEQKEVGLTWDNLTFPYDGQSHKPTATATGLVNGDTIGVTVTGEETNAGSYTATASVLTGTKASNYKLPTASTQDFTINAIEIKGALVKLDAFEYDTNVPTSTVINDTTVDGANGTIVQGDSTKNVTYYYQATAFLKSQTDDVAALANTEGVFNALTPTTFAPGKHYVLAVISGGNYTNTYITQSVFEVTKNTEKEREAELTTPVVEGTTVTVDEADKDKSLEYSLDGTTWKPVTLDDDNQFKVEWETPVTDAELKLRETADESYSKPSAAASGTATVTTTTFTVTYDANGGVNAPAKATVASNRTVTVARQGGMTRTGYTFDGWNTEKDGSGETYDANSTVNTGMTLYAQWTENTYTVRFNANGGTGTMEELEDVSYTAETTLPEYVFTRENYNFIGWSTSSGGSVMYRDKQTVKSLAASGTVTLYAVWAKDLYTLSGTLYEGDGNTIIAGVDVKLTYGSETIETATTDGSGKFNFAAPPALYNIVVTKDDVTKTALIDLTENTDAFDLVMPAKKTSSLLEVEGSNTPAVVVGRLEDVAADEEIDGRSIVVTMTVEAQSESENADAEAIGEKASGNSGILLLEISVEKKISKNGQVESTEAITDTGDKVIEIVVPYDFNGKNTVKVYRVHGDEPAEALAEKATEEDGTFKLDRKNGRIYIYASKFSTYAIGYSTRSSSGGGAVEAVTYSVTVSSVENGTVTASASSAKSGDKVTLTATPKEGYRIGNVTVKSKDGGNVAVTKNADGTYSFTMPGANVTVEASFIEEGACPKDASCPLSAFTDANMNEWYHDGVHWALENGVMKGMGYGVFAPNGTTTRAQVATMIYRLAGGPAATGENKFADVEADTWYTDAIRWAAANRIVTGYEQDGKTVFDPNGAVTREQIAAMLYRYAKFNGASVSAQPSLAAYPDASSVASWASEAMNWLVANGVIKGMDGKLNPQGDASRAQVATMLWRFCK